MKRRREERREKERRQNNIKILGNSKFLILKKKENLNQLNVNEINVNKYYKFHCLFFLFRSEERRVGKECRP